jgi:hypothetical protein
MTDVVAIFNAIAIHRSSVPCLSAPTCVCMCQRQRLTSGTSGCLDDVKEQET